VTELECELSDVGGRVPYFSSHSLLWLALLTSLLLVTSCASIRPVVKIGLLAPFEGLDRRSGYTALDATRTAIAGMPTAALDVIPLALDTSTDARRASQKLLQDGNVAAIIGPLDPQSAHQMLDVVTAEAVQWIAPFALTTSGFTAPADPAWAAALLDAVADTAHGQGAQRLVVVGWTPGWPTLDAAIWQRAFALPLIFFTDIDAVSNGDAVVWLGAPDAGARFFSDLRSSDSAASFWLVSQSSQPIFVEHAQSVAQKTWGDVFWAIWLPVGYTLQTTQPPSPISISVHAATAQALAQVLDKAPIEQSWQVQVVRLSPTGEIQPVIAGR
jgi:hypothetical protein